MGSLHAPDRGRAVNLTNHEYERCLLGCILLDNRLLDDFRVTPVLFDNDKAREVFREIGKTRAAGHEANIVTIGATMPNDAAFVATLTNVPSAANARFYYDTLAELAKLRGVVAMAREATEQALSGTKSGDVFEMLDRRMAEIESVREAGYQHVANRMAETIHEIQRAYESKGALLGVPTGFPGLDTLTNGWQRQMMVVIGARPGSGKTSIALNMATAALRDGRGVGFFSAEMSAASIIKRMIADWGTVSHSQLQAGLLSRRDYAGIEAAATAIAESKLFVNDQASIRLQDLVSDARRMRRKEGIDIVFVDYLSLVSNERRDVPRHEQVAEISKAMKGLARELDIPVVVLSQLTREAQGERPKLSQLRDSGAVEQDADMVILLHNLGYDGDTQERVKINLIVEKNRSGATGTIPMLFRPLLMRFGEEKNRWDEPEKIRRN